MTKASKLIENLITILDRDVLGDLCDKASDGEDFNTTLCIGIDCEECPFNENYNPETTKPLKNILKTIKTLELIDVDSK